MRKNGVNKEIRFISGGLGAPCGVRASGLALQENSGEKLALVAVDERCPIALCLPNNSFFQESLSADGNARAVCLALGSANVCVQNPQKNHQTLKERLATLLKCELSDILLFSVGAANGRFPIDGIEQSVTRLTERLSGGEEGSIAVKNALSLGRENSFAYAFELGDFPCLVGGVCSCGKRVSDGSLPLVLLLSTDVHITPKLLDRAFSLAYKDTLGMLGRNSSPFDVALLFSTQKAGNALIDREDGEYKKFFSALKKVLEEIAKSLAIGEGERLVELSVCGGKSKQAARTAAKNLAVRFSAKKEGWSWLLSEILSAIGNDPNIGSLRQASVRVYSKTGELFLLEEGVALPLNACRMQEILCAERICVALDFKEGNFSASAWARI